MVLVRLDAAAGSEDDVSCVVRFEDLTTKAVSADCVRALDEGVFPGYPEFGNPANFVPLVASSSAKFLLGERIARAEEMMEESPHGRHDDELRMSEAQLKAAIDAIEARFNFDTLSASCSEDVKSSRKLYELSLERVRTAEGQDIVGNVGRNKKLRDAKRHSRNMQIRYQQAKHKQEACSEWHARLRVLNKEF
eukprot:SAG11_NODE_4885_length_1733_cov_3.708078_2_plen_193_part_00